MHTVHVGTKNRPRKYPTGFLLIFLLKSTTRKMHRHKKTDVNYSFVYFRVVLAPPSLNTIYMYSMVFLQLRHHMVFRYRNNLSRILRVIESPVQWCPQYTKYLSLDTIHYNVIFYGLLCTSELLKIWCPGNKHMSSFWHSCTSTCFVWCLTK